MSYTATTWVDNSSPAISAANLNKIEAGIAAAHALAGLPIGLTGATQPTRFVGATTIDPPTSGTFQTGDFAVTLGGEIWVCTAGGSPGTWRVVGDNIVCTSTTRPSVPYQGLSIYETNTGKQYIYYGATTGWKPPWGMPWGAEGRVVRVTSNLTINNTATTVATMPSNTYLVNRIYRLTFSGTLGNSTGATVTVDSDFYDGSTAIYNGTSVSAPTLTRMNFTTMQYWVPVSTVTKTVTTRMSASATLTGGASNGLIAGTWPSVFIIEDIGPSGSTAPAS